MLQFQKFPIYVIYSLHRQQSVGHLWNQYAWERKNARENAVRQLFKLNLGGVARFLEIAKDKDDMIDAAIQWQLVEDLDPKYRLEIRNYESAIERILTIISHTSIGGQLLSMIKPDAKIFIIPADWTEPTAKTIPTPEAQGGGIRINFNPAAFRHVPDDETEETLFHELVHAMRMSNDRYGKRGLISRDFGDTEEFIATQFENVFHAARRRSDVYSTYRGADLRKDAMYQYLIRDAELIMALKAFLRSEPLAKATAHLHQPEYNPFRDFDALERESLRRFEIEKFPDLSV